jgi:hypothetical protein
MNRSVSPLGGADWPDEDEDRPDRLAALADLAHACGEQVLAQRYIDRLYAHYDRQHTLPAGSSRPP